MEKNKKTSLKRPNLWTIKSILEECDPELQMSTFACLSEVAASNRKDLRLYLNLLTDELHWLRRIEPFLVVQGEWAYVRTELGDKFLGLFPSSENRDTKT